MDRRKRRRLEAAGWRVGDAADLLELSPAEAAFIELRLELAGLLREVRNGAGMTQTQAAHHLGSSQSRVAKMEAADPTVSLDLLIKSLLALGATPTDISHAISKVPYTDCPSTPIFRIH
jgi:DNA-binding XRE family transcriptional regulator